MNIFDIVNEAAVVGTSVVMMAVSTVWYSSILFGSAWSREVGNTPADTKKANDRLGILLFSTLCSYTVMLFILAYSIAIASSVNVSATFVAATLYFFGLALFAMLSLTEGRSFRYCAIHGSFIAVFIFGGAAIMNFWPW